MKTLGKRLYRRYREAAVFEYIALKPFSALRETFAAGYGARDLRSDLLAGVVVALVAIPLGMALAIATGVPPQYGLYTVVLGGGVVALFGGSRCQVTGPTAAFVVILAPIVRQFGLSGLLVAGLMAGVLLVAMGMARFGKLIEYIPHPVTTGFTSGIAVVIFTIQLKDFFGLNPLHVGESFFGRLASFWAARGTFSPSELAVGLLTLGILVGWSRTRWASRVPAPLVALGVVTAGVALLHAAYPGLAIDTVASRFGGIPKGLPRFDWPWRFKMPGATPFVFSLEHIEELMPSAFAIAMLGAIESLLSAVVADGMAGTRHDPDAELVALGTGNIVCPFFGGIAATGAIARTATNIRFGARSPIAAIVHAVFTLLVLLFLGPIVSQLPMASLAALLILVAWNMSEARHFANIVRVAPRSDVLILLICFTLTVVFDMVIGVTAGILLAAVLFMRRMAALTSTKFVQGGRPEHAREASRLGLPSGVLLYRIDGPLFFGAARSAIEALRSIQKEASIVIFDLTAVPAMDITGLVALETAIRQLSSTGKHAILAGAAANPRAVIAKSELISPENRVSICETVDEAILLAGRLLSERPSVGRAAAGDEPKADPAEVQVPARPTAASR